MLSEHRSCRGELSLTASVEISVLGIHYFGRWYTKAYTNPPVDMPLSHGHRTHLTVVIHSSLIRMQWMTRAPLPGDARESTGNLQIQGLWFSLLLLESLLHYLI